jgi:hypothetical protein
MPDPHKLAHARTQNRLVRDHPRVVRRVLRPDPLKGGRKAGYERSGEGASILISSLASRRSANVCPKPALPPVTASMIAPKPSPVRAAEPCCLVRDHPRVMQRVLTPDPLKSEDDRVERLLPAVALPSITAKNGPSPSAKASAHGAGDLRWHDLRHTGGGRSVSISDTACHSRLRLLLGNTAERLGKEAPGSARRSRVGPRPRRIAGRPLRGTRTTRCRGT